jgi:hypothetical protein
MYVYPTSKRSGRFDHYGKKESFHLFVTFLSQFSVESDQFVSQKGVESNLWKKFTHLVKKRWPIGRQNVTKSVTKLSSPFCHNIVTIFGGKFKYQVGSILVSWYIQKIKMNFLVRIFFISSTLQYWSCCCYVALQPLFG